MQYTAEVWKFLKYKMHRDVDVEDSASMQKHDIIESLLPLQNNRHAKYFQILTWMREQTLSTTVNN